MRQHTYQEIYDMIRQYEELSFNLYRQLKDRGINNSFMGGVAKNLTKYKRATPKQLESMQKMVGEALAADKF